jgi:hypothetical protein
MATQLKVLAVIGLLPLATLHAQNEEKPHLVPLFSNVEIGPAFVLECTNTSSVAVRAGDLLGQLGYRVDGVEPKTIGGFAGVFHSEPFLQPTQTWRWMVALQQDNHGTTTSGFAARFQLLWTFPLTSGHHALSIRCLGNWSDEVEFYWDSTTVKR